MDAVIYLCAMVNMLTAVAACRRGQPQFGIARLILWALSAAAWVDGVYGWFAVFGWTAIALEFASNRAWSNYAKKRTDGQSNK